MKNPKVGKNILTVLTVGMYQDPRMIYREYIQNSADQIDELTEDEKSDGVRKTITIDINPEKRLVSIKDVATGITADLFEERLLNVADSHKDPSKNKGFRGIGRLAGLSYCKRLVFETTAKDEDVVSRLEMDCEKLREILHDVKNRSTASEVITAISTVTTLKKEIPSYECYFKVTLEGVDKSLGAVLLDVAKVKDFIGQIAPVPFSKVKFKLAKKIYDYAEAQGHKIEEYTVRVNGETITKPYKDDIRDKDGKVVEILSDVVFNEIKYHGEPLAWAWVAPCTMGTQLVASQNHERGIRLRKANIQIGFDDFLNVYFKEARSNGYMVGEVHILSNAILPNGDRNGLEVSPQATAFVKEFKEKYCKQLWASTRLANTLSAAKSKVLAIQEKATKYLVLTHKPGVPQEVIKEECNSLSKAFDVAKGKLDILKKAKEKETVSENPFVALVASKITEDVDNVGDRLGTAIDEVSKPVTTKPVKQQPNPKAQKEDLGSFVVHLLLEEAKVELDTALKIWSRIDEKIKKGK